MFKKPIAGLLQSLALSLTLLAGSAQAGLIYQVTGDIVPSSFGPISGSFTIELDTDDLTMVLDSSHPALLDPLFNGPWYGYDVTSANVMVGSAMWDENDILEARNEPATTIGGPSAQIWFQGGTVDGGFDAFAMYFEGADGELFLGFHTFSGTPGTPPYGNIITPESIVCEPGFSNCQFGMYNNLNVRQTGSTSVNEPGSLALLLMPLMFLGLLRNKVLAK